MGDKMKICTKCKLEKELKDFPFLYREKDGNYQLRKPECKKCVNEYMRNYLKGNKKHILLVNKHQQSKFDFITKLKLETGCQICGYKKSSYSLHYHHVDPSTKLFSVSESINFSKEKILAEISKCQLLCANCHGEVEEATNGRKKGIPRQNIRKVERPSKEELEKLLWEKPTIKLAEQFGVSDKAIEKWAKFYGIEKPPRGYWAKKYAKGGSNGN